MRRTVLLIPFVLTAVVAVSGCGGDSFEDGFAAGQRAAGGASTTPTAPAPSSSPAADPNARVSIPDVEGQNGAIALDALRKAGLTNVQPASKDEEDKLVVNPANWSVTKVEPGAGTDVGAGDTVVVTMTKE